MMEEGQHSEEQVNLNETEQYPKELVSRSETEQHSEELIVPNETKQQLTKNQNEAYLGCGIIMLVLITFIIGFFCGAVYGSSRNTGTTANNPQPKATISKVVLTKVIPTSTPIPTQPPTPTPIPTPAPTWHQIEAFSGNGGEKTTTFSVSDQWEIRWSCNPDAYGNSYNLIVQVDAPGSDIPVDYAAVNTICQQGNTEGTTQEYTGGTVYLNVQSESAWNLVVDDYS